MNLLILMLVACTTITSANEVVETGKDHLGPYENSDHKLSFEEFAEDLNSSMVAKLDVDSVNTLLQRLNEKCLTAETLFQLTGVDLNQSLNEEQFSNVSLIIAYYLKFDNNNTSCNESETLTTPSEARNRLFGSESVCQQEITALIQAIKDNGKYNQKSSDECIGSSSIITQCTTNVEEIDQSVMKTIIAIGEGLCLLPSLSYFQEELMEHLSSDDEIVTDEAFSSLLEQLRIGEQRSTKTEQEEHSEVGHDDHDDHNDHNDHDGHEEPDNHDDKDGHEEQDNHDDYDDHDDHDDEEDNHEDSHENNEEHDDDHEVTMSSPENHEEEEKTKCFSKNELMSITMSERASTVSHAGLTTEDVARLCPVLLQQVVTGACVVEAEDSHDSHDHDKSIVINSEYTTAMKYGYGTASVGIISLLALGGLFLFPSIGSVTYKLTMQFFIALGVGTLSGDALLHLIPEVLGLHNHEEGESHDHEKDANEKLYVYRLLVVVAGIYIFYLFENVLRLVNQLNKTNITFHQHDEDGHSHNHTENGQSHGQQHRLSRVAPIIIENGDSPLKDEKLNANNSTRSSNALTEDAKKLEADAVCCGVTSVGIMVFIGDVLHNFGDGLALGVAFSSSWIAGVGASIAIFCHELPHEFGDFAIYLKNGMSKWMAIGLNFVAAVCAFIGLYIGLSVAENPEARQWMLAVIAGMFLYIALVDVLHEMAEEKSEKHPILQFFLQNLGLCIGWTILLLLALYEEDIRVSLQAQ